jgi:hypothetical protein
MTGLTGIDNLDINWQNVLYVDVAREMDAHGVPVSITIYFIGGLALSIPNATSRQHYMLHIHHRIPNITRSL